jgi:hypothetical protein
MKIASKFLVAFLAGVSVATWTSLASAQSPGWAAAAAQCRAQVGNQYPTAEESSGTRNARARALSRAHCATRGQAGNRISTRLTGTACHCRPSAGTVRPTGRAENRRFDQRS